jgi:hypothetical protein
MEHYKNPNAAGQGVWVDARGWGRIVQGRPEATNLTLRQ